MQENDKSRVPLSFYGTAISLGLQMAVGVAIFTALGYYVDRRRGGGKAFTLAGVFLGLFYGGYEVWKIVRQINEEAEAQERRRREENNDLSAGV